MEAVKQYYLEAGKKVFDELGPETLRRRGVTERVLYGDIGKTLAEEAEVFKADLIVMGTRGLNPVKGCLLYTSSVQPPLKSVPQLNCRSSLSVQTKTNFLFERQVFKLKGHATCAFLFPLMKVCTAAA